MTKTKNRSKVTVILPDDVDHNIGLINRIDGDGTYTETVIKALESYITANIDKIEKFNTAFNPDDTSYKRFRLKEK